MERGPRVNPEPPLLDRFRDRIREFRRVRVGDHEPHPWNARRHPGSQMGAVTGLLVEVGKVAPLLAFPADGRGPDGDFSKLRLFDGHLRRAINPNETWWVAVTDLTRAEADLMLAAYDPTGDLATVDPVVFAELLVNVDTQCDELRSLLDSLGDNSQAEDGAEVELKQLNTLPPPVMSWALIGIPTVRFGEIAERLESLAVVEGIIIETTSNNG